jgi:hypothetical protein
MKLPIMYYSVKIPRPFKNISGQAILQIKSRRDVFVKQASINICSSITEISNRFTALENSDAEVDNNRAWETIRENVNISAKENLGCYELKKHKLWFGKGCSQLLDQRKQAKLQWLRCGNLPQLK